MSFLKRILFQKEGPGKDKENWPNFVLFKGSNRRLPGRWEYLIEGSSVYKL